jgi:hypothetical protein
MSNFPEADNLRLMGTNLRPDVGVLFLTMKSREENTPLSKTRIRSAQHVEHIER